MCGCACVYMLNAHAKDQPVRNVTGKQRHFTRGHNGATEGSDEVEEEEDGAKCGQ